MPDSLELIEQPRFAEPRLRNHRDHLSTSGFGGGQRALHLIQLRAAADEPRESATGRPLQPRPQRPQSGHLVNLDGLADSFDLGWTDRRKLEISLYQLASRFAHHYRAGSRNGLHP